MSLSERRRERVERVIGQRLASVVVVVEAVRRRHNTSAILRSAEAFGLHEVHLVTGEFRPSKGAARGAERWLEIHRHAAVEDAVAGLKARGFQLWIADPVPGARDPHQVPVDRPVAVLFGSELAGVSEAARALADGVLALPMSGLTESLNVSAAAATILYTLTERRRGLIGGGDLEPERGDAFYAAWLAQQAEAEIGLVSQVGEGAELADDFFEED